MPWVAQQCERGSVQTPRGMLSSGPSDLAPLFWLFLITGGLGCLRRSEKNPGRTPTRVETFLETGKITGPATHLAAHVLRRDSCSMAMCPKHTAVFCRLVVVAPENSA